jgi:hypothetical protein
VIEVKPLRVWDKSGLNRWEDLAETLITHECLHPVIYSLIGEGGSLDIDNVDNGYTIDGEVKGFQVSNVSCG